MKKLLITAACVLVLTTTGSAQQDTVETRIGVLEFEKGYPSQKSVEKLYDEIDFQRACDKVLVRLTD